MLILFRQQVSMKFAKFRNFFISFLRNPAILQLNMRTKQIEVYYMRHRTTKELIRDRE